MNLSFIDKKIDEIKQLQQYTENRIPDAAISGFSRALKELQGWNSFRINPLDFAAKNNLAPDETVNLFIYGAKTGLFSFEWSLLCPLCGGREHSYNTLNQLEKETYHCTLCDVDVEVQADSHLEVSFTMPENITGFSVNPYISLQNYWSYFFSSFLVWSPELSAVFNEQPKLRFAVIPPGKKTSAKLELTPVKRYRIVSLDTHSIFRVNMEGKANQGIQKIDLEHFEKGFNKKEETITGVAGVVEIINKSNRTIGCIFSSPDSANIQRVIEKHAPYFKPFVTGKMMLNNQFFRDLFLTDNLPDDLSLKINDITLLFTDLKGSTELYDKTGDVYAYKLVQKHFKILQKVVHAHDGGIVKTMGDAVMSSFNTPYDGISAAFSMLEEINAFNRSVSEIENAIGLKIGIHRGNVIAVKANQTLDYFGQTVNIAARVQGLAGSGEIWIMDDIMKDNVAADYLHSMRCNVVAKEVALKGVGSPIKTHLCYL